MLVDELESVRKKASAADQSTSEKSVSAQRPRPKISPLSVKAMFFTHMDLFVHDRSDREETLPAPAMGRFTCFVGVVSRQPVPYQEMAVLKRGKGRSP